MVHRYTKNVRRANGTKCKSIVFSACNVESRRIAESVISTAYNPAGTQTLQATNHGVR